MKQLFIVALLVAAAMGRDYEAMFREFKAAHLKSYASTEEEQRRFGYFVANMKQAELLQAANPLATFGANQFADMSAEEFKKTYLNGEEYFRKAASMPHEDEIKVSRRAKLAAKGEKIDWREKGAVSRVKDQGGCGSCWAFSATGNIEGQWFLAGHPLTEVSEQELISCDTLEGGCNGGLMEDTFDWLIKNRKGEIVTEKAYPYTSDSGIVPNCSAELDKMEVGATIRGYNKIEESEDAMAAFVLQHGPLAICLDASSFVNYQKGILTNCISKQINYAVLIVGYDDTNVPPYWIIKNSWGTTWGEKGYIRVAKGSKQCLISSYSVTATIGKANPVAASNGNIVQIQCGNSKCTENCKNYTFPIGECLPLSGGGSAKVDCTEDEITIIEYTSEDCSGAGQKGTMPTKQCLQGGGGYFVNYCLKNNARIDEHKLRIPLRH